MPLAAQRRLTLLSVSALAAALLPTAAANAQKYICTINPTTSTLNSTLAVSVSFSGTMVGNYVQTTNPGGTRTLLGLGGSTAAPRNDNIPVSGVGGTGSPPPNITSKPAGTYALLVNRAGQTVTLYALNADLLGASAHPLIPVSVSITYSTFRTIAPNYTYFWLGVPIPISLGNGEVTAMRLTQDAPASGTLTPAGGDTFTFSLTVPCTLESTILLQGTNATNTSSQSITINGSVTIAAGGPATITSSISIPLSVTQTVPPTTGTPTPFELPPPPLSSGANAQVILTANIVAPSSATVNGTTTMPAAGARMNPANIADDQGHAPPEPGIPNGGVNEGDYNAFFIGFFDASPWCDIADDQGNPFPPGATEVPNGGVNEGDYNLFFQAFFA